MKTDARGDRCKRLEMAEAGRKAMPGLPLLARLDGKAFHTFTRGLARPYDKGMSDLMVQTTCFLVEQIHARIGYTQSDEITLLFHMPEPESQLPFDGRFQKLTSVLAGMASARFAQLVPTYLPQKTGATPCFDCRVWQVPSMEDVLEVFLWREDDAVKNSISMAACEYYSQKELHQKTSSERQEMLFQHGINWNNYPAFFKRGTYVQRRTFQRLLTPEEREKIPPKNRPAPDEMVTRSVVNAIDLPPLRRVGNVFEVFLDAAFPTLRESVHVNA